MKIKHFKQKVKETFCFHYSIIGLDRSDLTAKRICLKCGKLSKPL